MDGTIAKVWPDKRYAFIRGEDGADYFFHASGLQVTTLRWDQIRERQPVTFTPIDAPKGPRAIEVRVVR